MVADAYVNHVPAMMGGFGKAALREFYSQRFIPSMQPDTALTGLRCSNKYPALPVFGAETARKVVDQATAT
jgi:hypothetical protein